jgi:hypothetical protein
MDESDNWPSPNFNPGPRLHLHALGVIALTFATFESGIGTLYPRISRRKGIPEETSPRGANALLTLKLMKRFIREHESGTELGDLIENLLDYFDWCQDTRNQILHAERYPATFGSDDVLYLIKPLEKGSTESGHFEFTLDELRDIAVKMRLGVVQCAEICLYVTHDGGGPLEQIDVKYRRFAERLPAKLDIPEKLRLAPWSD